MLSPSFPHLSFCRKKEEGEREGEEEGEKGEEGEEEEEKKSR